MSNRDKLAQQYPEVYKDLVEAELVFQESMYLNNIVAMNADAALTTICKGVLEENAKHLDKTR